MAGRRKPRRERGFTEDELADLSEPDGEDERELSEYEKDRLQDVYDNSVYDPHGEYKRRK